MSDNNNFKWNNNNNNDFFNTHTTSTSLFNFNNNDSNNKNFNIDMIPDDDNIQDDEFQNIIMSKNNSITSNSNRSMFENTYNNSNNSNSSELLEYTMDNDDSNQQQQQEQMEMEEVNQFEDIFNDKSITDDIIYHNTLEDELLQPKTINDQLKPIELSNTFLKLSQAKINSINNDESNRLFYMTTNRKQKETQLKNYQMEKDTWSILNKLYSYRDIQRDIDQNEKIEFTHSSQVQVYQYIIKKNYKLRENSLLLEWLEEMSSNVEFNINDQVFWEHTLIQLKKRNNNNNNNLVTELDIDSQSRQNKAIDKDDEKNQNKFLQTLWSFLRAGDRDGAVEYCISVGQYWRAQTLLGLKYYDSEFDIGNPYFNLWKSNCFSISKNAIDPYERAIYGLLSGNLDSILPIQKNWYDYFWCYLRVLYDETLYRELLPYRSPLSIEEDIDTPLHTSTSISQINTPKDILEILKNTTSQIEIKNQSENPYHIIQELIINDDYNLLFESLPNLLLKNKTPEFNRFAVLLIIFYRKRDAYRVTSNSKDCPENIVINEYVQYLINTQQYELVALYTSLLNNEGLQVEVYSKFLVDITDQQQRQQCLVLAEKFGLNTQEIAQTVVKNITAGTATINISDGDNSSLEFAKSIKKINDISKEQQQPLQFIGNIQTTGEDLSKIDSIKWLLFDQELLIKAILQSNLLIRDFIRMKKYLAASELLKSLPKDIVLVAKKQSPLSEQDTNNIIKEFRDWENYIASIIRMNHWYQNLSNKPNVGKESMKLINTPQSQLSTLPYSERLDIERKRKEYNDVFGQWSQNNINYAKEAIESIRSVIKTGWLCPLEAQNGLFDENDESGQDVTTIRKACIPPLFACYNRILVETGSLIKSSQLCNLIANERFRWYSVFSKKELQDILQSVRESSIKLLSIN